MNAPSKQALKAGAIAVTFGLVALVFHVSQDPDNGTGDSDASVRIITLERVSNASGLVIIEHEGQRVAATVDEVDEWNGPGKPPPLVVYSSLDDGRMIGGWGRIAQYGEVEALAVHDDHIVFPYKTDAQSLNLREGDNNIPVVTTKVISKLKKAASQIVSKPFYFEFEGLAATKDGWELVCSVVRPDARDTPRSTMAIFRLAFTHEGSLTRLSPPVRNEDGSLYTDYAAALDVLSNGLAIIPGFHNTGVVLVNWKGDIVKRIDTPSQRVEGVVWDDANNTLYLVRECVGENAACKNGVHFGVPLWILRFNKKLTDA